MIKQNVVGKGEGSRLFEAAEYRHGGFGFFYCRKEAFAGLYVIAYLFLVHD